VFASNKIDRDQQCVCVLFAVRLVLLTRLNVRPFFGETRLSGPRRNVG